MTSEIDPDNKGYVLYLGFIKFMDRELHMRVTKRTGNTKRIEPKSVKTTMALLNSNPVRTSETAAVMRSEHGTEYVPVTMLVWGGSPRGHMKRGCGFVRSLLTVCLLVFTPTCQQVSTLR